MQCEIVMIGTELLLGQIVDTNAAFLGRVLAENGINLYQKTTVGDNPERIRLALDAALNRSDVLLLSGGLGPTEDDITRECIAELLGRPLEFRPDLYEDLVARFARYRYVMTENNRKQAFAPQGARSIPNPHGTAPGLIVEDARGTIICMPGVPGELKPMLTERVIPYLRERFGLAGVIHSRVLKVCGIGESRVDAAIGELIKCQQNPTVGVLASMDAVRIRITARAADRAGADRLIDEVDAKVRERLPGLIMGIDEDTIERVVARLLSDRGWRIAVAETSPGGLLAQRLSSTDARTLAGGLVFPMCSAGMIPALSCNGAGAEQAAAFAREIAEQTRSRWNAEAALGIAPDPERQRTLVQFLSPEGDAVWELSFLGADERGQLRMTMTVLEYIRRHLLGVRIS